MGTEHDHDLKLVAKFRGIDPFVFNNGQLHRLTKLDATFLHEYNRVKELVINPRYVKFIESNFSS